jgi:hypothetical protein
MLFEFTANKRAPAVLALVEDVFTPLLLTGFVQSIQLCRAALQINTAVEFSRVLGEHSLHRIIWHRLSLFHRLQLLPVFEQLTALRLVNGKAVEHVVPPADIAASMLWGRGNLPLLRRRLAVNAILLLFSRSRP